jgi:hypothetical protein
MLIDSDQKHDFPNSKAAGLDAGLPPRVGIAEIDEGELTEPSSRNHSRYCNFTREGGPLDLFGGLWDGRSGGLEAYFGMGSVAEWLVGRCPAATERNGGLARKIDLLTVGVNQLDRTFHAKWSVWSHRDGYFTLSHEHPSSEI